MRCHKCECPLIVLTGEKRKLCTRCEEATPKVAKSKKPATPRRTREDKWEEIKSIFKGGQR